MTETNEGTSFLGAYLMTHISTNLTIPMKWQFQKKRDLPNLNMVHFVGTTFKS